MNPFHDSDYVKKSHEALVELFEPCCDAAENLHALEKVFDQMPGQGRSLPVGQRQCPSFSG